jgi:hypothetical protein
MLQGNVIWHRKVVKKMLIKAKAIHSFTHIGENRALHLVLGAEK